MRITNLVGLVEKTKEVLLPYGGYGLFGLAFIESSFFPVPPDVLLISLVLLKPESALFYATICVLGSVAGAIFGYYLGYKGGRPLLLRYAPEDKVLKVQKYFDEYGVLAVGLAAFTPIPYKVFSISSGVFKLKLPSFIIVSLIGRGARFFAEALILMYYGEAIISYITQYFEIVTTIVGIAAVFVYLMYRKLNYIAVRKT